MPEPYVDLTDRESVIRWLLWDDPNGCYTDDDCRLEGLPVLTLDSALDCYYEQSGERRDHVVESIT